MDWRLTVHRAWSAASTGRVTAVVFVMAPGWMMAWCQRCRAVRSAASAISWAAALGGGFVQGHSPVQDRGVGEAQIGQGALDRSGRRVWFAQGDRMCRGSAACDSLTDVCLVLGSGDFDLGGGFDAGGAGVAVGIEQLVGVVAWRTCVHISDPG